MSIGFHIVNKDFYTKWKSISNVKQKLKKKTLAVYQRIIKASLAYQYLWIKANKELSLKEILEKHSDLGLIGPGHGTITHILEKFFSSSQTLKNTQYYRMLLGTFS